MEQKVLCQMEQIFIHEADIQNDDTVLIICGRDDLKLRENDEG